LGCCGDGSAGDAVAGRLPVARREHRQEFWAAIARGASSEEAGIAAGVSPAVGSSWFRERGGMPPTSIKIAHSGLWVPETLRTPVDLPIRRRSWPSMISRWR
jgi:hypothetical protein